MRFKVTPFTHPEYEALRLKSEFLASMWGTGHVFLVVFVTFALAVPVGIAMDAMIYPEFGGEAAWDTADSIMGAALIIAVIGYAVKRYASKRGRNLDEPRRTKA